MQHTSAAQQRPGEKQALTASATQNKTKALTDHISILKLKHPPSQPGKTTTAGRSTSGETEAAAIRIRDTPSPLPRTGSMTHATPRAASRTQDPTEIAERCSELSPGQARDPPFGEEYMSAGTVLRLVHGGEDGTQTLQPPQGQLQKPALLMLTTHAIAGAAHCNQVTAEKAGRHSKLSPGQI